MKEKLAIFGGKKSVTLENPELFRWPKINEADKTAVMDALCAGTMSGTDITLQFEKELAEFFGCEYALCYVNGTASIYAAMWACGVKTGDEIICQSEVYWAACAQALSLGATVNFADIDPETLCIDPNDIEHRIGSRTKAIIVVHSSGHPADMDKIMAIARKHDLKVIEDISHAQGSLYKGQKCGTIGDVGAFSMMSGKSLICGEGGALITNNRKIFERAICFSHYERVNKSNYNNPSFSIQDEELKKISEVPLGTCKHRLNQLSSALGRSQLKRYPEVITGIQNAMNRFWDQLEGLPGIRAHRPPKDIGSTMGGWYYPRGIYLTDELGGLSLAKFAKAVNAEGSICNPQIVKNLHLSPLFQEVDIYGTGKPTVMAFSERDLRHQAGDLPNCENMATYIYTIPYFTLDDAAIIEQHANAYRKVIENYKQLL
jgi:perosamine synthetase